MIKITNLKMNKEIVFDNQSYVLSEKDLGSADIDLETYQGNNQIGVQVTGRHMNSRDISLVGFILADDEKTMLERKRTLQRMVSPFEDFYLVIDNYKIQVSAVGTIEYATEYYKNNKYLAQFFIKGNCANPCFTDLEPSFIPVAFWEGKFHFPFHMSIDNPSVMGVRQPSMIKMIENKGETPIGMKIILTANGDGIHHPFITNLLTQEKIRLWCDMNKGDTIEINTNYGEKSVIKNGFQPYFYKLDVYSDFIQLAVGENYLRYGAEENEANLSMDIICSPQYLEV